jgi:hypothetical protein
VTVVAIDERDSRGEDGDEVVVCDEDGRPLTFLYLNFTSSDMAERCFSILLGGESSMMARKVLSCKFLFTERKARC